MVKGEQTNISAFGQTALLTLCFENSSFASSCPRSLVLILHTLQHRRVLQHVWQDQEADLAPTDVDLLQLCHAAIAVGYSNVRHLEAGPNKSVGLQVC